MGRSRASRPEPDTRASEGGPDPGSPSDRRMIGLAFIAVSLLALSISAQTYLAMRGHGHSFWRMLGWQFAAWSFWPMFTPLVCGLGGRLSVERPASTQRIAQVILLAIALIGVHTALAAQLALWFQPYTPTTAGDFTAALVALFGSQSVTDILVFLLLLFVGSTLAVSARARQLALRESRLETALAKANLEALRLEIQPHFLFNTLNSIAALIRLHANDQALEMLLGLSALMRATVDREPTHVTPLAAELEFVKRYIELQHARHGDRLEVRYAVAPESETFRVPTFLLQPLVENAFRHGLSRRAGQGHIELGATPTDHGLRVWVSDDGAGLPPGFDLDRDAGTGLSNIRVRLQQLYGPDATMTVATRPGGGTVVTVLLPHAQPRGLAEATA